MAKTSHSLYDQNGWKTTPFVAAHTYVGHIREYFPPNQTEQSKQNVQSYCLSLSPGKQAESRPAMYTYKMMISYNLE